MAGGATGEGEALDYASTVVHALAPTHGSSQVRTYFDNYLAANNIAVRAEGQAGRLNTAFTVGGGPRPWVVCGRSAGSHERSGESGASISKPCPTIRHYSECWRSNPGPSSGSGHNHNPWRCFAWSGYGCSNSRGKQDGRGEWFGARWVEHCTEHNPTIWSRPQEGTKSCATKTAIFTIFISDIPVEPPSTN